MVPLVHIESLVPEAESSETHITMKIMEVENSDQETTLTMKITETESLDQETHLTVKIMENESLNRETHLTMEKRVIKNDTTIISKVTLKMLHIRLTTTYAWNWQSTNIHDIASLYKI